MSGSTRDSQRSLVYEAEAEVEFVLRAGGTIDHFGSMLTVPEERKFGDVESVQPYVNRVLAFAPVARLPRANLPVRVRERQGVKKAHYERRTAIIAIPPYRLGSRSQQGWALRETVVLHELAHHLTMPGVAAHGPEFTATLVYLFEHVIGPEAAHLLRVALWERGVTIGGDPTASPHTCTA